MVRVLIADDHAIVRRGIAQILAADPDIVVADEVANGREALLAVQQNAFDVLVLDIAMPEGNGLEVLEALRQRPAAPHMLILSMYPEKQYAVRAIRLGADGYLTKDSLPDELLVAVRQVAAGGKYISHALAEELAVELSGHRAGDAPHTQLSTREYQVMCLIASGKGLAKIAAELKLSVSTVNTYRQRILKKLGAENTAGIIRYAVQHGLLE